jgi:hypothetical protein
MPAKLKVPSCKAAVVVDQHVAPEVLATIIKKRRAPLAKPRKNSADALRLEIEAVRTELDEEQEESKRFSLLVAVCALPSAAAGTLLGLLEASGDDRVSAEAKRLLLNFPLRCEVSEAIALLKQARTPYYALALRHFCISCIPIESSFVL